MQKFKVNQMGFLQIWKSRKWRLQTGRKFNAGDEVKVELANNSRYFMICRVVLFFEKEKTLILEVTEFWKNGNPFFLER